MNNAERKEPLTNTVCDAIAGYKAGLVGGPMGIVSAAFDCGWISGHAERRSYSANTTRALLQEIVDWELPETGDKWPDGSPVGYGAKWGTNGERDYIREVARRALEALPLVAPEPDTQEGTASLAQNQQRAITRSKA